MDIDLIFIGIMVIVGLLLIGIIGLLITSFSESFGWGLAVLFLPFGWIFFIVKTGRGKFFGFCGILAFILWWGVLSYVEYISR